MLSFSTQNRQNCAGPDLKPGLIQACVKCYSKRFITVTWTATGLQNAD